jgi:hypothetical protein
MKKVLFLILVLGLVFSLSACSKKSDDLSLKGGSASDMESFSGSLRDLVARGKSLKCTYSVNDITGGQMTRTTYVSGKKSLTQSKLSGTGQDMESNILVDGDYMYLWSNMAPRGSKMNMKKMEETKAKHGDQEDFSKDYDEEYDYKCSSWKKDESKFQLPQGIEFMDLTALMTGTDESAEETSGAGCSVCDMMPDEAQRNECLVGLGCE